MSSEVIRDIGEGWEALLDSETGLIQVADLSRDRVLLRSATKAQFAETLSRATPADLDHAMYMVDLLAASGAKIDPSLLEEIAMLAVGRGVSQRRAGYAEGRSDGLARAERDRALMDSPEMLAMRRIAVDHFKATPWRGQPWLAGVTQPRHPRGVPQAIFVIPHAVDTIAYKQIVGVMVAIGMPMTTQKIGGAMAQAVVIAPSALIMFGPNDNGRFELNQDLYRTFKKQAGFDLDVTDRLVPASAQAPAGQVIPYAGASSHHPSP